MKLIVVVLLVTFAGILCVQAAPKPEVQDDYNEDYPNELDDEDQSDLEEDGSEVADSNQLGEEEIPPENDENTAEQVEKAENELENEVKDPSEPEQGTDIETPKAPDVNPSQTALVQPSDEAPSVEPLENANGISKSPDIIDPEAVEKVQSGDPEKPEEKIETEVVPEVEATPPASGQSNSSAASNTASQEEPEDLLDEDYSETDESEDENESESEDKIESDSNSNTKAAEINNNNNVVKEEKSVNKPTPNEPKPVPAAPSKSQTNTKPLENKKDPVLSKPNPPPSKPNSLPSKPKNAKPISEKTTNHKVVKKQLSAQKYVPAPVPGRVKKTSRKVVKPKIVVRRAGRLARKSPGPVKMRFV